MTDDALTDDTELAVRALMRKGLSDEAIAKLTGLDPMRLLELRAAAAVEERHRAPDTTPGAGRPG